MDDDALRVDIPSVGRDRDHIMYTIQVEKGDIVWTVRRRYRDFSLLHKRLSQTFSRPDDLPKLPPNTIKLGTAKFDEDFVEQRRGKLLMYLVLVVSLADPERVETVDDFLEFSENYIFGSLHALEHVQEAQAALAKLRRAAAGTGTLTVARTRDERKRSFDEDGGSVMSAKGGSVAGSSVASEREAEHKALDSDAKPTLQAALTFMVQTLENLTHSLTSQSDDAAAELEAQNNVLRFLTVRFTNRKEELSEAKELWADDQRRALEQCTKARAEHGVLESHIDTLDRELTSVRNKIVRLEGQTIAYNARFRTLRGQLLAMLGSHPGAAPAPPPLQQEAAAGANTPRSVQHAGRGGASGARSTGRGHRKSASGGSHSMRGDTTSDEGGSSVAVDDSHVPGAAAGIAAAASARDPGARLRRASMASGASDDEGFGGVSEELLAEKVVDAERVRGLMEAVIEDLAARVRRAPSMSPSPRSHGELETRMLDVATRAGSLHPPGASGNRAEVGAAPRSVGRCSTRADVCWLVVCQLLKLCRQVMEDNLRLAGDIANAVSSAEAAAALDDAVYDASSPAQPRRLQMVDSSTPASQDAAALRAGGHATSTPAARRSMMFRPGSGVLGQGGGVGATGDTGTPRGGRVDGGDAEITATVRL